MAKIYKGIPYTGTLPAVLTGTKAGNLHRYKIYGNTEQTGTPTPENPIVPQECGERTGNLFDSGWEQGYISVTTGENQPSNNVVRTAGYIPVEYNKIYSMSRNLSGGSMSLRFYDAQKSYITGGSDSSDVMQLISGQTYNNPMTTNLVFCCFKITDNRVAYIRVHDYANSLNTQYMMVEGEYTEQTMPTYIPYGYKLPLLSGSTPVDIYLGESQTTRRIRKLVLTGRESWGKSSARTGSFYLNIGTNAIATLGLCDRAINVGTIGQYDSIGKMFVEPSGLQRVLNVWLFDTNLSLDDFKTYLQQQYANGTPVTVWYVLATEETGILNEPLRKIGDYADTIDSTQTTTQIPTSANSTTISWAGEGLAPSLFESIREWVNIMPKIYTSGEWVDAPTYTYTNGEWVADTQ